MRLVETAEAEGNMVGQFPVQPSELDWNLVREGSHLLPPASPSRSRGLGGNDFEEGVAYWELMERESGFQRDWKNVILVKAREGEFTFWNISCVSYDNFFQSHWNALF